MSVSLQTPFLGTGHIHILNQHLEYEAGRRVGNIPLTNSEPQNSYGILNLRNLPSEELRDQYRKNLRLLAKHPNEDYLALYMDTYKTAWSKIQLDEIEKQERDLKGPAKIELQFYGYLGLNRKLGKKMAVSSEVTLHGLYEAIQQKLDMDSDFSINVINRNQERLPFQKFLEDKTLREMYPTTDILILEIVPDGNPVTRNIFATFPTTDFENYNFDQDIILSGYLGPKYEGKNSPLLSLPATKNLEINDLYESIGEFIDLDVTKFQLISFTEERERRIFPLTSKDQLKEDIEDPIVFDMDLHMQPFPILLIEPEDDDKKELDASGQKTGKYHAPETIYNILVAKDTRAAEPEPAPEPEPTPPPIPVWKPDTLWQPGVKSLYNPTGNKYPPERSQGGGRKRKKTKRNKSKRRKSKKKKSKRRKSRKSKTRRRRR
jgi:hypothetical protein